MNWFARNRRRELRLEEQKFVDAMRPKSKVVLLVPANSPCTNCMQNPGDGICRSSCSYWKELMRMKAAGKLKKVGE